MEGQERLPIPLSPGERAKRAQRLAALLVEIANVQDAKAESTKLYNDQLKGMREEAHELAEAVYRGTEERLVAVDEIRDVEGGDLITVRTDTGEEIRRRPLTDDERQVTIEDLRERRAQRDDAKLAAAGAGGTGPSGAAKAMSVSQPPPATRTDEPHEPVDVDPADGPQPEAFEID